MYISDREKKYRIRVPDLLQPLQSFRDFNRNQVPEKIFRQKGLVNKSFKNHTTDTKKIGSTAKINNSSIPTK